MASLLQVILIGFMVIIVLSAILNLILPPATVPWQEIIIRSLIFFAITGIPLFLLRRGFFRASVFIIIAIFLGLETYAVVSSDMRSIAETLSIFTFAILLAGLLVGRWALIGTFVFCAAICLIGAFRSLDATIRLDSISIAVNFILLNGVLSLFLDRFGITLRTALKGAIEQHNELRKEIAEREKAQTEREKLIAQLEENNAELERFTFTVSHDLRSPLVTVKGFLGMLEKDIQNNQAERIRNDFQRISSATDQMQTLLTDLLELSRIGRVVNPSEDIDLSQLAREALIPIESQVRDRNIQVHIADLPPVYADRVRMREVMQNLIENAAKYMGSQPDPVIEIGAREQHDQPVFYVRDNGIGIDPQYHTRIFGLFEKLDPSVEGTGIGLAIVKRIIELHGGQIWVESEGPGKGSTFCFTVPDKRKKDPPDLLPVSQ